MCDLQQSLFLNFLTQGWYRYFNYKATQDKVEPEHLVIAWGALQFLTPLTIFPFNYLPLQLIFYWFLFGTEWAVKPLVQSASGKKWMCNLRYMQAIMQRQVQVLSCLPLEHLNLLGNGIALK